MKRTNKRKELIRVGSEIVARQGFKAASLNDILSAAGVPKGSFYYYFSSKEEFGLAIIDDFASHYLQKLKESLDNRQSPLISLHEFFHSEIAQMEASDCAEGCLMGNLAQELAAQNEVFRDRINRAFASWEHCFATCLLAAYEAGEISGDRSAADLAKFILFGWEGAILQAKVMKTVIPMQIFVKILFEQVLSQDNAVVNFSNKN